MEKTRIVVGISGASGAPLAVRLLTALKEIGAETHLIISSGGKTTLAQETGLSLEQLGALSHATHDEFDFAAPPSSGSWKCAGMVVVPCSMKTLAGIRSGYSDNLLLRAADVTIKEGRTLVLVPRECPMSPIHLRNQYELSMMGVRILPPVLSYYQDPECIQDMEDHLVGKILDQLGLDYGPFRRWGEKV